MRYSKAKLHSARRRREYERKNIHRQHPSAVMRYTTKNFWMLLIPALRALITYSFDLGAWVKGMYLDIIVIVLMFGQAWLHWYLTVYELKESSLIYHSGFITRMTSEIPYRSISAVTSEKHIWQQPFRCAYTLIDTDSQSVEFSRKDPDLKLIMRDSDISLLFSHLESADCGKSTYHAEISKGSLIAFSLLFSSALSGVAIIAALMINAGNIVGDTLEQQFFTAVNTAAETVNDTINKQRFLIQNIPVATIALAIILCLGWIVSFTRNLLRHMNFRFSKQGGTIKISDGAFTQRKYCINSQHINCADLRQNLLMKLFRVMSVNVSCAGYGKAKNEIPVFIPISSKKRVHGIMRRIMPDIEWNEDVIHISYRYVFRYLGIPIFLLALTIFGAGAAIIIFPEWYDVIFFTMIMLLIPVIWLLIVKAAAFVSSGISYSGGILCVKYCAFYGFHTLLVPESRIAKLEVSRNIFQQFNGSCDMIIYTNAEYIRSHRIRGLRYKDACELLDEYRHRIPAHDLP